MQSQAKQVPANDEGLKDLMSWTALWAKNQRLSEELEYKVRLVVEEIATNVMFHGFDTDVTGQLACTLSHSEASGIEIKICDDAKAFNPLTEAPTPDIESDLSARGIGGMGVFLVVNSATSVDYQRRDNQNELTVVL